jgi:hypothetical protein
MAHFLLFMRNCVISTSYENFSLTVNLILFHTVAFLLSLLGFARKILQAINFMYEKAEASSKLQPLNRRVHAEKDQRFLNRCL